MSTRLPTIHLAEALGALASIEQPKRAGEPPVLTPRNVKRRLHLHNGEAEALLDTFERLGLVSALQSDGRSRVMFRETWLSHREARDERAMRTTT